MEVISTRRYEARPPADSHASILVDPRNAVATVKEEEWETRKKKEITTTRQIETRVKRQVVLEDGEVVVDSGPLVTTNTTEDVEQQEHTTQERRTTGDEPQKVEWPAGVTQGAVVQKELNETIVKSREEIEELLETEDQQQLGDITDEAYLQAVRNNRGDLRVALAESKRQLAGQQNNSGPRVLQHTTRSNKVVDTEKTLERSELKQDGQIVTERKTTVEHEEIKDDELPEEINGERDEVDEAREIRKEASQRYVKTRDEDIVDYVQNGERVAREMRFVSETTEAERTGDWPNEPPPGLRTGRSHKHEKQSSHTRARSPAQYIVERTRETSSSRLNGHHPASATTNTENARNHKETSYTRSYETASSRRHQERHSPPHERPKTDPPSPPLRRKAREQVINTKTERNYQHESVPRPPSVERGASPVHVVQRTWESRSRDVREERRDGRTNGVVRSSEHERRRHSSPERSRPRPRTPDSRSISPSPARSSPVRREKKEEQSRPSKSPSPSKYKIGESFRKLVGKLRSASSERRNKRTGSSSTSQLTQTDDSSTYLQYNSVDRNIPLGPEYDTDDRPPERPPRSPRNAALTTTVNVSVNSQPAGPRESKSSSQSKYHKSHARSASPRHTEFKETTGATASTHQRNEQPIHRYYLGEDPYGGSIYGREKGYRESKMHSRTHRGRTIEEEYSAESNSLGRFSKSTGRLANDYDQTDHERISAQTLPRKMHISNQSRQPQQHQQHQQHQQQQHQQQHQQQQQQQHHTTSTTTTTTTTRRMTNGHNSSPTSRFNNINNINNINNNNINNINNNNNNNYEPSRQYGSMINISFRNTVTSPKTTHFVQTSINTQPPPPPQKPERTYKSTLSRSKSFNVEIADDGIVNTPRTNGYSSNIRSSSQLNKLDETPPLKSPGILASINRSNRDLMMRNGKHEY